MRRGVIWGLLAALIVPAATAGATQQGEVVLQKWLRMDKCARAAQAAFPDFTAESNAKRDERLRACLNQNNLPPRAPAAPAQ